MASFDELLAATGLPDAALAPLKQKWSEALALITQNNKYVAQVNAARAQDPNNADYLDSLWKANAQTDNALTEKAEQFYAVAEEYEKLLKELREGARKHIPEQLSEERTKEVRKLVNESAPAIQQSKAQFGAMAMMVDGYLDSLGKGIEGGLVSLLPEVESLKNVRGRKAATGSGEIGQYMARIVGAEVNGRNIHRDNKVNFRILADSVSNEMGADKFPENKVTGEEIEEAYFKSIDKPFRSMKTAEVTSTFDFTKTVTVGDNKTETRTVSIKIIGKEDVKPETDNKSDAPATNTPATSEPAKVEAPKEVPAPAKKAAAPAKK